MNIILYKNKSEFNRLDKVLENVMSMQGTLKNECSILSPSFLIECNISVINEINYLYISDWHRYYFISNITSVRNNLWQIDCKIDVLTTYAPQIRTKGAIISRQENLYNLYLEDSKLISTVKRNVNVIKFPNSVEPATRASNASFVLSVAGTPDV